MWVGRQQLSTELAGIGEKRLWLTGIDRKEIRSVNMFCYNNCQKYIFGDKPNMD